MSEAAPSRSRWLWLLAASVAVRLAVAWASGALHDPFNKYGYHIVPGGPMRFRSEGFLAPGGFWASWLLFQLAGRQLAVFGASFVLLGAGIPLLLVRIAPLLFPGVDRRSAWIAGSLAVVFPPLVFLSATWRYMLFPVLFGLWHLDAALRRRGASALVAGTLLLLTRPDFFLGSAVALLWAGAPRWRRSAALLVAPCVAAVAIAAVAGRAGSQGNFWYNVDAGLNARTREALAGFGWEAYHPEQTLPDQSHDEALHRRRVGEFVRRSPELAAEALVLKLARVFEVRRDGALLERPFENVVYSAALLAVLAAAALGLGRLGLRGARPGVWVLLAYALPMVLVFSLDRTRVLLQALWLPPAAACVAALLPARSRTPR